MSRTKRLRLLEFVVIGVLMGVFEDLIAIAFATDSEINLTVIWIVLLVAIPFAFLSEVVVDHPRFWEKIFPPQSETGKRSSTDRKN